MIVTHLPRGSALVRVIEGDDHPWGLPEQLLAAAVDALHAANWQRGEGKERDKPKPIPRPGVEADKKYGKEAIPMDEMADWLGWSKELATPEPVRPVDKTGRRRDSKGRFTKD